MKTDLFKYVVRFILILAVILWTIPVEAQAPDKRNRSRYSSFGKTATEHGPLYQILNINNIWTWARADGYQNHSPSGNDGAYFPRGTSWVIYQDGLVWGGKAYLDAELTQPAPTQLIRVGGQTYNVGTRAGRVIGQGASAVPSDPGAARIYRIRRDYITMSEEELRRDAAESFEVVIGSITSADMTKIKEQYAKDWAEWPVEYGAPFIDRNGNGLYDPPPPFFYDPLNPDDPRTFTADSLIAGNYDEPGVAGADPSSPADQVIWTVYNDLDRTATLGLFGSEPLGLEVQMTLWGYDRTDAMGNLYFKRFKIINKGGVDIGGGQIGSFYIDSMFVAQWSDPDVGAFGDDLSGCDTLLSLGFTYNGNPVDSEFRRFNLPPPAVGYDFLQGPIVPAPGDSAIFNFERIYDYKNLELTSFAYFAAGSAISDPPFSREGGLRWWRMLQGFVPDPSTAALRYYPHPPGMQVSKFPLSGDPVSRSGFIDGQGTDYSFAPGDRRIVLNTGPFVLTPGDEQEIVVGTVAGMGSDRLSSVAVMKFNDRFVQNTYDAIFQVPRAPVAPDVKIVELDSHIMLEWGSNLTRVRDTEDRINEPGSYVFEGYNVYQLPSRGASLSEGQRIATYDLETDPTVILDEQFHAPSGQILFLPVQFGSNSGIKRYFKFDRDYVRDIDKLYNGQEYYLAVTAYSRTTEEGYLPAALESSPTVFTVVPQSPKPGLRYNASATEILPVSRVDGSGDATIEPIVIDPASMQTGTYTISWSSDGDNVLWNLLRNGNVILGNQTNVTGDETYSIIDGLQVKVYNLVYEPPVTILEDYQTVPEQGGGLTLWGDATLFGAPTGFYSEFVTGEANYPASLTQWDLEFRFTGVAEGADPSSNDAVIQSGGQWTTIWERGGFGADDMTEFAHAQIRAPFELWDVENNIQINFSLFNRNADDAAPYGNDMDQATARYRMSGRDYIIPIYTPYDPATAQSTVFDPNDPDATWLLFFLQGGSSVWNNGDVYFVKFANPIIAGEDAFAFAAEGPTLENTELAKEQINAVNVFPNPYYAFNPAETNRFVRFVTFTHLTNRATVRIFNLAGQLVRTMEKDDDSQFLRWDLNNQFNYPVASGMYIAHIELTLPNGTKTSKVLKLAIIQEQEVLDVF